MRICVLYPDLLALLGARASELSSQFAQRLPSHQVEVVLLGKATLYRQLKALKKQDYDIFVNLCQGDRSGETVSCYEVTAVLEDLNLPYTGSSAVLYDAPKQVMKHIAYYAGIETAAFAIAQTSVEAELASQDLQFPLFVKPAAGSNCAGVDARSRVHTAQQLQSKVSEIIQTHEVAFIEEYVDGREFSVLVAAHSDCTQPPIVYPPIEVKSDQLPFQTENAQARSYQLCTAPLGLQEAARQVFSEVDQGGYACIDFRVDAAGEIFFIDINSPCPILADSVADAILELNGIAPAAFLDQIITEGIARHQRRQRKYQVKKSPIATYGIFACQAFQAGDVIVSGETAAHRIVTRSHVQSHWSMTQRQTFLRYTPALDGETLLLRNPYNPADWLLQNHSCDPNTAYRGLDLIATRSVQTGEELTVDFATFRDESGSIEFDCQCGAANCRGAVRLQPCLSDAMPVSTRLEALAH